MKSFNSVYINTFKHYKDNSKVHFLNAYLRNLIALLDIKDLEEVSSIKEHYVFKFKELHSGEEKVKKPKQFYEEIYNTLVK